ncbi:MAG: hypothetical protein PHE27_06545 [Alphaproteobacteria bacterium]|nr:hypothetical protein [Alphaproteobacteria bacterium]
MMQTVFIAACRTPETEMGKKKAELTAGESVSILRRALSGHGFDSTSLFFNFDGQVFSW